MATNLLDFTNHIITKPLCQDLRAVFLALGSFYLPATLPVFSFLEGGMP